MDRIWPFDCATRWHGSTGFNGGRAPTASHATALINPNSLNISMRYNSCSRFVSASLLAVLCLCWPHRSVARQVQDLVECSSTSKECLVAPCSTAKCKDGYKCLPCGCAPTCTPAAAQLQTPLHMCADGSLALSCDILSSVKPGTTCALAGACKLGYVCKEYLCASGCQAKCVLADTPGSSNSSQAWPPPDWPYFCPDGTPAQKCSLPTAPDGTSAGKTCEQLGCNTSSGVLLCMPVVCGGVCANVCMKNPYPPVVPPGGTGDGGGGTGTNGTTPTDPSWPPADWPYYCLDGSPAAKCDQKDTNTTSKSCEQLGCGGKSGNPAQPLLCAPFKCGGAGGVCQMTCVKHVSFNLPPSLPPGPLCPDGNTTAQYCSSGAAPADVDAKCAALGCEADGAPCGEFQCGSGGGSSGQCSVTCVKDSNYRPYRCPSGKVGRKCNPMTDQPPVCNPPCNDKGTFCAPLYCEGSCNFTCVRDPNYVPPMFACPSTGQLAQECSPTAAGSAACKGNTCGEALMCRFLNCGSGCQAQCVKDPSYIAPQPSPYICPADNSTASMCFSSDGAAACVSTPPGVSCEEGSFCGEFKCGNNACKPMCVRDPNYRPYLCPGTDKVAHKCELKPGETLSCPVGCGTQRKEFFCAPFECDGVCAPVCMRNPWYEPPTYLCDGSSAIAQECTPSDAGTSCAAISCPEGFVCGGYDCSGSAQGGGTSSGGVVPPIAGGSTQGPKLAGTSKSCKFQCVKDPTWVPPVVYKCANGEKAAPCGPVAGVPVFDGAPSDAIWPPKCELECTELGSFCMLASCGASSTCSATCVKDENYVPPPPLPTFCTDPYSPATLCKSAVDEAACSALQCSEQGFTCAAADCGDGSSCSTRCITQGYLFPGVPTTPLVYSCEDGSMAQPCKFAPAPGQATCAETQCEAGMACADYMCGGACGPMCVPLPPATMMPGYSGGAGGSGNGTSLCPGGALVVPCKANPCSVKACPDGQVCYQSPCNCSALCVLDIKYKGPVHAGKVHEGTTGGSKALRDAKVRACVRGTAVAPKTCAADPCASKKCDDKTQKCVREFCGGCFAACAPKDRCPNNSTRRACINTANFCITAKCARNQTCIASQCNDCKAKCVGPCSPGKYASRTSAQCELCPRGFSCSGSQSTAPDPVPCNNGTYAKRPGQYKCTACPMGKTTPASPPDKGYLKCS